MPARQSLAGANPLQRRGCRGQLLDVCPHALLGGFVSERRLKTVEREHALPAIRTPRTASDVSSCSAAWAMASFFWLCDVDMRSPIVCVPTII